MYVLVNILSDNAGKRYKIQGMQGRDASYKMFILIAQLKI